MQRWFLAIKLEKLYNIVKKESYSHLDESQGKVKMEDRRIFVRIHARVPLRFLDPSSGREVKAETMDISANSVGFITNKGLPAKVRLEMWLDIPDQHEPLYVGGSVVWSKVLDGTNQQRVGVCLENQKFIGLGRVLKLKYKQKQINSSLESTLPASSS